jgi:outer membrane protein OmpA-like peptidoglycan-associated protein
MRHGVRLAIVLVVLSPVGSGCARVEWTEQLFAKQQAEVDERFVRVETEVREHDERIDRIEVRVSDLDTRVAETRDMVRTATAASATVVAARPAPPEPRPVRPAIDRGSKAIRTLIAVVHVPFGFDQAELDPGAEAALTAILKELRDNANLTIDLEGSTDTVGKVDYNVRLSQRRVETVKRWLMGHGVAASRIVGATARGPLVNGSVKDDLKRRVMVKLMSTTQ